MRRSAWVFDLDGTLTVAIHDFAALKRALGLPAGLDVLGGIASRPASEHAALHEAVHAWEVEHAARAAPAPGAAALLTALSGARRGVLTRNTRASALVTLDRVGLRGHFDDAHVLGRDDAAPKPAPDGLLRLLGAWGARAADGVMVGDHADDLRAGRAAGMRTIGVDERGRGGLEAWADRVVRGLDELLDEVG